MYFSFLILLGLFNIALGFPTSYQQNYYQQSQYRNYQPNYEFRQSYTQNQYPNNAYQGSQINQQFQRPDRYHQNQVPKVQVGSSYNYQNNNNHNNNNYNNGKYYDNGSKYYKKTTKNGYENYGRDNQF